MKFEQTQRVANDTILTKAFSVQILKRAIRDPFIHELGVPSKFWGVQSNQRKNFFPGLHNALNFGVHNALKFVFSNFSHIC